MNLPKQLTAVQGHFHWWRLEATNHNVFASISKPKDAQEIKDVEDFAKELAKRWNAYEKLVQELRNEFWACDCDTLSTADLCSTCQRVDSIFCELGIGPP